MRNAMAMRQTRTSPLKWRKILKTTYDELLLLGANDVIVFGSQAMSMYLKRALASKDLDLIATELTLGSVSRLCEKLAPYSDGRAPDYGFTNNKYDGRSNPVFSIYLKPKDNRPFVLELFQTYLGHDVRKLTPYVVFRNRFQTLSREAIIGTRLAFRLPEGITPFNARRLNKFIEAFRTEIRWGEVTKFVRLFNMEERIAGNLKKLKEIHNIEILDSERLNFLM